jgi:hypothetical protein
MQEIQHHQRCNAIIISARYNEDKKSNKKRRHEVYQWNRLTERANEGSSNLQSSGLGQETMTACRAINLLKVSNQQGKAPIATETG